MTMESRQISETVRIGRKSVNDYLVAALLSLEYNDSVTLEALGRWNGKVFAVAERLGDKDNLVVSDPTFFVVDGTEGIRVVVKSR